MAGSSLLKLPPEIRNEIYAHVLYQPDGVHLHRVQNTYRLRRFNPIIVYGSSSTSRFDCHVLALAQTCRQIRSESYGFFFSLNIFHFQPHLRHICSASPSYSLADLPVRMYTIEVTAWKQWLEQLDPINATSIHRLILDGPAAMRAPGPVGFGHTIMSDWWTTASRMSMLLSAIPNAFYDITTTITVPLAGWSSEARNQINHEGWKSHNLPWGDHWKLDCVVDVPVSDRAWAMAEATDQLVAAGNKIRAHANHECETAPQVQAMLAEISKARRFFTVEERAALMA